MESINDQPHVSYQNLLKELETTKKQLGETEESLKRITGRNPQNFNNGPPGVPKWKNQMGGPHMLKAFPDRNKPLFPIVKKPREVDEEPEEGALEDSGDEDEIPSKKPSLASTVVARPKDLKSRKETIQEQNINSKVKARNRRMLGMILGTLQKFQHEATKHKDKEQKRAEIEQKLEAAAAEEKERLKKEKEQLFETRKEKQVRLRCLEKKLEIAELHDLWERNQKCMTNFILTNVEPKVYFLPATHTPASQKRLEESKAATLELIREHRLKMEHDIAEVDEWYKRDSFPVDKENIGPPDEEQEVKSQDPSSERAVPEEDPVENPPMEVEAAPADEEGPGEEKDAENLTDQEFEPIYD